MNRNRYLILTLVFTFIITVSSFAQINNPLINSGDLIKKAAAYNDEGKYKDAIDVYKQVSKSDSNYADVLYGLGYSCYLDSQMDVSYKYAAEGIELFPERFGNFSMLEGNILDNQNKTDEAIAIYDKVLAKDPQSVLAYFNKGISLKKQKKDNEAKKYFEQCILINPYYSSAHYFLGYEYLKQGKLIPAMLAFKTYLLLNPGGKYRVSIVNLMSDIAKVADDVLEYDRNKIKDKEDNFDLIQQIVISKIALSKEYKLKAALEDNIVRQIQVIDENLQYNKNDKGFCMQFYVPLYQQIFKDDEFEPMIFTLFSGLKIKSVDDWNKKNKKKLEAFSGKAVPYFNKVRNTQVLDIDERNATADRYLFSDGVFIGKGLYTKNKSDNYQFSGNWEFYYDNGELQAKGLFNDQYNKDGEWFYYYNNGQLKQKAHYKNGVLEGSFEGWWDNGNRQYTETYNAGKIDGMLTLYYYNDNVKSINTYTNDKKNGPSKSYNSNGQLTYSTNYIDDQEDGTAKNFYASSGVVENEVLYKKDKAEGVYKAYAEKGTVATLGQFSNGIRQGLWTDYYDDGTTKAKVIYVDGEITGEFTEYFDNGKLSRKGNYTRKKIDGKLEDYDDDGKIYSDAIYEKGMLKEINFYDKSGKNISSTTTRKGAGNIVFYSPDGIKVSECYFNKDGNKDGKNTFYYPSGKIKEEAYYKDGLQNGSDISYYTNGQKESETTCTNDKEDGYIKGYFVNGKISYEGWKIAGDKQQHMIFYNNLGDISSIENYLNDDLDGYTEYKYPHNIPDDEYRYSNGWLEAVTQFDSTGKVIASTQLKKEKGKSAIYYKNYNGKISAEGHYDHYMLNGEYKVYFFDGKLSSISYYKNNQKDSIYKNYFYNGALKTVGNYKNGKKDSVWKYYYDNGKLSEEEVYKDGMLNGADKSYNEDGGYDYTVNFKNDTKEGPTVVYGDSNKIAIVFNYKANDLLSYTYENNSGTLVQPIVVKEGVQKVVGYYRNGIQSCNIELVDKEEQGVHNYSYSNGKLYIVGTRYNGYDNGPITVYYNNGVVNKTKNMVLGKENGPSKTYYLNGKLKKDENYYNNQLHGACKYYDEKGNLTRTRIYYYDNLLSIN